MVRPWSESPGDLSAVFRSRSYRANPPATCAAYAEWALRTWSARPHFCASLLAVPYGRRRSAALRPPPAGRGLEILRPWKEFGACRYARQLSRLPLLPDLFFALFPCGSG